MLKMDNIAVCMMPLYIHKVNYVNVYCITATYFIQAYNMLLI